MIHFPQKISVIGSVKSRVRNAFDRDSGRCEPRPRRDWFTLLAGALVVFVLVALSTISISYYYGPARLRSIEPVKAQAESSPFSKDALTKVLRDFEQKREAFLGLLVATSTAIVDPAR